jgi:hypothetical protein
MYVHKHTLKKIILFDFVSWKCSVSGNIIWANSSSVFKLILLIIIQIYFRTSTQIVHVDLSSLFYLESIFTQVITYEIYLPYKAQV